LDHRDHVDLIRDGVTPGGTWADLGSGTGAFTLALAELVGPRGSIYSVDRDTFALRSQADALQARFPAVTVRQVTADFTQPLDLPTLDGLIMANSLHFVREKADLVERLSAHLREGGRFVLVEYDADRGNRWVPFPISYRSWTAVATTAGLCGTRRIGSVPSRFLGSIYAAVSDRPAASEIPAA
jgi:ubiquinone/menaquinone biosynthesis C-methylase UbiE